MLIENNFHYDIQNNTLDSELYQLVYSAKNGDSIAIEALLSHYEQCIYMSVLSFLRQRKYVPEICEIIKQRIRNEFKASQTEDFELYLSQVIYEEAMRKVTLIAFGKTEECYGGKYA